MDIINVVLMLLTLLVLILIFIRKYFVTDQLYEIDFMVGCGDEGYCYCPNEQALLQYCQDGGWDDIQDLLDETGLPMKEFINKWFLVVNGRVFTK